MGKYIEQYAHDLYAYLILGRTRVKFDVRKEKKIVRPGLSIVAKIIGESHIVVFEIFGMALTEIIACVRVKTRQFHWSGPVDKFGAITICPAPGVQYHLQTKIFDWEEGANTLAGISNFAASRRGEKNFIVLREQFPPKVAGGRSAETIVIIELEPVEGKTAIGTAADVGSVNVHTVHTYPDDRKGKIVQTVSCLEKKLFAAPSSHH